MATASPFLWYREGFVWALLVEESETEVENRVGDGSSGPREGGKGVSSDQT